MRTYWKRISSNVPESSWNVYTIKVKYY
jgi:hypothetical protein